MIVTKHPYMISTKYCENWTPTMAAREFFANALDTGDELAKTWYLGFGMIYNNNTEFDMNNLLLGESGNRSNSNAIGQFGEGLKIGALVLARNGRKIIVKSKDKIFTFTVETLAGFDAAAQTLVVEISNNDTVVIGTIVKWECPEIEFETAKNMFYEFQDFTEKAEILFETEGGSKVLDESGAVYICGVKVQDKLNLLFGYDINSKELLNRDRTILDMYEIKNKITGILEKCDSESVIEALIKNQLQRGETIKFDELNLNLWVTSTVRPLWTETLARLYGDKICLSSGVSSADARAEYMGYKVLDMGQFSSGMVSCLNIKRANEIKLEESIKFVKKLESSEKKVFNKAIKAYKLFSGCNIPDEFHVSEELEEATQGKLQVANNVSQLIINRNQLVFGPATIYMILCHEGAHLSSHSGDCSASFEAAQDNVIEHMARNLLFKGWNK
jgi:hypothetical protein